MAASSHGEDWEMVEEQPCTDRGAQEPMYPQQVGEALSARREHTVPDTLDEEHEREWSNIPPQDGVLVAECSLDTLDMPHSATHSVTSHVSGEDVEFSDIDGLSDAEDGDGLPPSPAHSSHGSMLRLRVRVPPSSPTTRLRGHERPGHEHRLWQRIQKAARTCINAFLRMLSSASMHTQRLKASLHARIQSVDWVTVRRQARPVLIGSVVTAAGLLPFVLRVVCENRRLRCELQARAADPPQLRELLRRAENVSDAVWAYANVTIPRYPGIM